MRWTILGRGVLAPDARPGNSLPGLRVYSPDHIDKGQTAVVQLEHNPSRDIERVRAAVGELTGLRYIQALARVLTEVLGVAYAFVAERSPGDKEVAQTVAVAHRGGPVANLVFLLAGTPCQDVIADGALRLAHGARHRYYADQALTEMAVECYVGVLLAANGGTSCGWLGVMDTRPRPDTQRLEAVLQALGARTSIELAHMRMARRELQARDSGTAPIPVQTCFTSPSD